MKQVVIENPTIGSTRHVDFDTTEATYTTRADRCHVSHVVCDKEVKVTTAQTLWIPAVNNHGEFGRWAFP